MSERYLTVPQVAERLQLTEEIVRRWLRDGKLHGTLLSRRAGWRVADSEVDRVLRGEPAQRLVKAA